MNKLFFILIFSPGICFSEGPLFRQKDAIVQQEFENVYQDLRTKISTTTSSSLGSYVASLNASAPVTVTADGTPGSTPTVGVDGTVTVQGNTFNGASQLIKTDSNSAITVSSASINNLYVPNTKYFVGSFQMFPIIQVQNYTTATSSTVTSATFTNTLLSGSFTPKFSTSKLLIFVAGDFAQSGGASVGYATLARNGTNLASGSGGFTTTVAGNNYSATMFVYDSPSTTSAITYSVQIRTNGGGTALFPITDGGSFTSTANMIIAEIAQ